MSAPTRAVSRRGVSLTAVAATMFAVEAIIVWLFAGVWFPGLI
jgi:hypothetical protein